jgi:SNF2 family DNA or RNA helicase
LNLVEADYVYLIDPWWNPAVENQAIDRCYRIGQDKKVIAVRLITPNSIEEKIMDLQFGKTELINDLIKVDDGKLDKLNKDFLLSLINE